jgi:predicted aconitase with swiveling domain
MGTAPAAIITAETDAILALGAAVAQEIYGESLPILVLLPDAYRRLQNGQLVTINRDGLVAVY